MLSPFSVLGHELFPGRTFIWVTACSFVVMTISMSTQLDDSPSTPPLPKHPFPFKEVVWHSLIHTSLPLWRQYPPPFPFDFLEMSLEFYILSQECHRSLFKYILDIHKYIVSGFKRCSQNRMKIVYMILLLKRPLWLASQKPCKYPDDNVPKLCQVSPVTTE